MRYLLDTNALSDLIRRHPDVRARLRSVEPTDVTICPVVLGELLHGIRKMPRVAGAMTSPRKRTRTWVTSIVSPFRQRRRTTMQT
jgi:predicted nucleic acid-binding protein